MRDTQTIIHLIRSAQAGDRIAFDRIIEAVRPDLQRRALAQTGGDAHQAGDLVQEICVRAWVALPQLKDREAFTGWLRTIAANVQYDRVRRRGFAVFVPLQTIDNAPVAAASANEPARVLLAHERTRELLRALHKLPGVSRDALLWHVWGDVSYEEIARLQGVPISTVEGRIYRAKRQLRKLLLDEGAAFFATYKTAEHPAVPTITPQRKLQKNAMSLFAEPISNPALPARLDTLPFALVLFAQRFAALIDGGVSLVASLNGLVDLPAPYGEAARELCERVQTGELPSRIMKEHPERWGQFYIALVHVGEMGGILEETMRRVAQLLTLEWQRPQTDGQKVSLLLASPLLPPTIWEAQTAYQQTVTRLLFCESAALMLAAGVPLNQVWQVCGAFLPPEKRALLPGDADASETVRASDVLHSLQIFPAFVQTLVQIGEANGTLDVAFHKAAEAFEQELSCLV